MRSAGPVYNFEVIQGGDMHNTCFWAVWVCGQFNSADVSQVINLGYWAGWGILFSVKQSKLRSGVVVLH